MAKTINELLEKFLPEISKGINRQSINQFPEVITGTGTSSKGYFYYLIKGSNIGATITSIKTLTGVDYPASIVTFINEEVTNGTYFFIPFSEITLSEGTIMLGRSDFK
jgi:hypothetical protein